MTESTKGYRPLSAEEIVSLQAGGNRCGDWSRVLVADGFDPSRVSGCSFSGEVRIGGLGGCIDRCGLHLPTGLYGSRIDGCTIGSGCAVYDVHMLSGYTLGSGCLLFNVGTMTADPDGRWFPESISVGNENGRRPVYPFPGMVCADAYLMAAYPQDSAMIGRFRSYAAGLKVLASVGEGSAVINVPTVVNVHFGPASCVRGAVLLASLVLESFPGAPVTIEGNAVLQGGIMGAGSRVSGGCIARNFVTGENCTLSGGVRFFDSILGDNSTVSCCEIVSALLLPAHEQHHNNSFLIAARVGGQSNLAAGATIGSNHNSRAADGEILAGRGFWPGLCVSLKHNSRFASFCLLAKGSYPYELDICLPFCLVSDAGDHLELLPAYHWRYNMYALMRNERKFGSRDRRVRASQKIEFSALAPDTVGEICRALKVMNGWISAGTVKEGPDGRPCELTLPGGIVENSRRPVLVKHFSEAMDAYRQMVLHFGCMAVLEYLRGSEACGLTAISHTGDRTPWENVGGQLMRCEDVESLRALAGGMDELQPEALHKEYETLWRQYPIDRLHFALSCLADLAQTHELSVSSWKELFGQEMKVLELIAERVACSRRKDFENPFQKSVFAAEEESAAVYGSVEDDALIADMRARCAALAAEIRELV